MFIITRDEIINFDNYDVLGVEQGATVVRKHQCPGKPISKYDVLETVVDAIRRGDNYVEVD